MRIANSLNPEIYKVKLKYIFYTEKILLKQCAAIDFATKKWNIKNKKNLPFSEFVIILFLPGNSLFFVSLKQNKLKRVVEGRTRKQLIIIYTFFLIYIN